MTILQIWDFKTSFLTREATRTTLTFCLLYISVFQTGF